MRARGTFAPPLTQRPGSPRAPFESAPSEGRGPIGSGRAIGPALTVGMPMIQRGAGASGVEARGKSPLLFRVSDRFLAPKFYNSAFWDTARDQKMAAL